MKAFWAGFLCVGFALTSSNVAFGFNGHTVTEGPLTVTIAAIPTVTNHQAQICSVNLSNASSAPLRVDLQMAGLIDECYAGSRKRETITIPAVSVAKTSFEFFVGKGACSALYPVHIVASFKAGQENWTAHAIQIFETDFSALESAQVISGEAKAIAVPASGVMNLASSKEYRVVWRTFESNAKEGSRAKWNGNDEKTGATFYHESVARGESRQALHMHPPFRTGAGTILVEYRLKLPNTKPLSLEFFNAIRDHTAAEPPSDGVTFRAWIGERAIFERHTASKMWVPGDVSLDEWAEKEIVLRLESDPGPKRDTTCDSSYWGDPTIRAGAPTKTLTSTERERLNALARKAVQTRKSEQGVYLFGLAEGITAAIAPGPNGVIDAAIAFGTGEKIVCFEGLNVSLSDQPLGGSSGLPVSKVNASMDSKQRLRISHRVNVASGPAEVIAEAWTEGSGIRLKISSQARITDLSLRQADQKASKVYFGHGYCIVKPGKFRSWGGGHDLATSHVGFDFSNGLSLLMACDTPPDTLQVDPEARIYSIHAHPSTMFTFVAGTNGAMNCALAYRPLYDKKPAPAVRKKAGRFVFDIWGGSYADDARLLQRCFDYGVTNSMALMHVWQRWGYDYRLPDVFPPMPSLGTTEDLRELGRVCDAAGALWGVHDNYIDLYPDATDFSYAHVTFDAQGRPRKAWLNEGRDAQSFQFRPDHVRPFLERNLEQIAPALKPSASFVDVWTSLNAFDYYDRNGDFHSKMETLRCWGEGFARIRDTFGGAPTVSEAGGDQLIGWLDGADCQFLQLGIGRFNNNVPCQDWARVPWFDLVNHSRFSQHGVGYSDRYQGNRSREEHGIESDDYLSAEILTGHALMVDLRGMVRGAVRKYWLAQDFIQSIALDDIQAVDLFPEEIGDAQAPHRLRVRWSSGAEAWVNRGTNDWETAGRILPPFGFFAHNGQIEASVERISGQVVEKSSAPGRLYVNGRSHNPDAPLAIRPYARRVERLGERSFRLVVDWHADQAAPKDLAVFYHFKREVPGRYMDAEFYGGGFPVTPTSKWDGVIETGTNWVVHIPEDMPLGDYDVVVGLYDGRGNGRRYRLQGADVADRRYKIGKLVVDGSVSSGVTNISGVRLEETPAAKIASRVSDRKRADRVDFGQVQTGGGVRVLSDMRGATVIPLPDGEAFQVGLNAATAANTKSAKVKAVHEIDSKGATLKPVTFREDQGMVWFSCEPHAFGYRIDW